SMTATRLAQQTADEWSPTVMDYVAVIDRSPEDLTAAFGWTWTEGDEAGLGRMLYVGLAYDGRSRFMLIASLEDRGRGVALEAAQDEDPARARADFLNALGLAPDAFLSIREGACWFERWEEGKTPRTHRGPGR
ncbi:MAG: hypothetical protein ACRDLN_15245, partial [Solirubrobacteraceae bacterium]